MARYSEALKRNHLNEINDYDFKISENLIKQSLEYQLVEDEIITKHTDINLADLMKETHIRQMQRDFSQNRDDLMEDVNFKQLATKHRRLKEMQAANDISDDEYLLQSQKLGVAAEEMLGISYEKLEELSQQHFQSSMNKRETLSGERQSAFETLRTQYLQMENDDLFRPEEKEQQIMRIVSHLLEKGLGDDIDLAASAQNLSRKDYIEKNGLDEIMSARTSSLEGKILEKPTVDRFKQLVKIDRSRALELLDQTIKELGSSQDTQNFDRDDATKLNSLNDSWQAANDLYQEGYQAMPQHKKIR